MLQQDQPEDFVLATGETRSVREFLELAFKEVGIEIEWRGSGIDEKGFHKESGEVLVEVDRKYFGQQRLNCCWVMQAKQRKKWGGSRSIRCVILPRKWLLLISWLQNVTCF